MTVGEFIFAVLMTSVAVSYGWGMRGLVIGGEKGAMLPGALLGLFLAKMSGIPMVSENAVLFSAVGALSMAYGGFEPYGQTMEMIICHDSDIYNPKRGYSGLMLKGGNWFGICATLLGMSFTTLVGYKYKWYETTIIILLIPFIQVLGIGIFNKPLDKEKRVFPKIYFSRDRREEWGGNLLTLVMLLIIAAVKSDWYSFLFGLVGVVSGSFGWVVAIWFYDVTAHPLRNGKYILGNLQKKGYIDNWKIMEFTLGLLGGAGLSIYFFATLNRVEKMANNIKDIGLFNPLGLNEKTVAWLCFTLVLLMAVQYMFKKLQKSRLFELLERAIYYSVFLLIIMLGSVNGANLVTFLLILWVVVEKTVFDRLENTKVEKLFKVFCFVVFLVALVCEMIFCVNFPLWLRMVMYTFFYIFTDIFFVFAKPYRDNEKNISDKFRGCILTYSWFVILAVVLVVTAFVIFE